MRLPFGLDLKTAVVTALFLYFALPWIMGMVARFTGGTEKSA